MSERKERIYLPVSDASVKTFYQKNELEDKISEITFSGSPDGFFEIGKWIEVYFHLMLKEIEKRIAESDITPQEIKAIQIEIKESEPQADKAINVNIEYYSEVKE